jgi:hypothetical protein
MFQRLPENECGGYEKESKHQSDTKSVDGRDKSSAECVFISCCMQFPRLLILLFNQCSASVDMGLLVLKLHFL